MKAKRIVIIGAGGMAREIESALRWSNKSQPQFEFLGYVVSDSSRLGERDSKDAVLGDFTWMDEHRQSVDALAIGIGSPAMRLKMGSELKSRYPDIELPALIHPAAFVDFETCQLGEGSFVAAGAILAVNVVLEPFVICNLGVTVGHETRIGRGSVVSPGANLSGGIVIEDGVLIGTGAHIHQYLRIGTKAVVGMGTVVIQDVPEHTTVFGVPARPMPIVRTAVSGK